MSVVVETYEFDESDEFDESQYKEENYDYDELDLSLYKKIDEKNITEICLHKNSANDKGVEICADCGIEIYKELSLEPEWRYYGDNDSKHSSDPSRCHIRKIEEKNIYKDIEKYNFPVSINEAANSKYIEVTGGKIRRGNFRQSIIYACIFNAYKDQGDP